MLKISTKTSNSCKIKVSSGTHEVSENSTSFVCVYVERIFPNLTKSSLWWTKSSLLKENWF